MSTDHVITFPEIKRHKPGTSESVLRAHGSFLSENEGVGWLQDLRNTAAAELQEKGLPTPKLERFKYTNIMPLIRDFGENVSDADVSYKDPDGLVKPMQDADASWPQDILSQPPVRGDRYQDMMLWDLSNAYLKDALVIDVPSGFKSSTPIEMNIHGHDQTLFMPRMVVRLADGAELTIIEHHKGSGAYWNNAVAQIQIGKGATLRHYRIQDHDKAATYTQSTAVEIEESGVYESFTLTQGAALSRNQVNAMIKGEDAFCGVYGINLLGGSQLGDTTVEVEHQAKNARSNQFIRSVLTDQSRGVYQGKVHVFEGADDTDGYQLSNALLLSDACEMDTKPELEIYADDVRCSHGATCGQLEDHPMFYLRSRGLSEQEAKRLLVEAFFAELTDKLTDEEFAEQVMTASKEWLDNTTL